METRDRTTVASMPWRGDPALIVAAFELDHAAFVRSIIARLPAFHAAAACRGKPTEWFFPERGASVRPALEVCAGCPVREKCLDAALAEGPPDIGIRGGTSAKERRKMRQNRTNRTETT